MNIAELGVKIDSADAIEAKASLDEMAKAGGRAEQSAVSLMNEMQALEKSLGTSAKTTQEVAKQRDALAKLTRTGAYGEAEAAKISAQLDKQQVALAKSAMDEQKALNSLLDAIDPTRAALSKLDTQVEQLGKHMDAGLIDQQTYSDALKKLDGKYAELDKTSTAFASLGLSTKGARENVLQLGNALAEGNFRVAAHNLLEIGTSAGASSLGLAALGASILPVTALIGSLGYAYYDSSRQAKAFNDSLILTGGAAGRTGEQLASLANSLAGGKHFAEADEAVSSLARSGRLTGEVFEEVARAATETAAATGKSAADIAEELSSTKGKVTDLAVEYSNKYGVITQSTYDQIRALEEQGDRMGAIKTLSAAVADEMSKRNKEMEESTRGLAKAWSELKSSIASAYNQLTTGLQASPELFRLQVLQGQLEDAQALGNQKLITYYQQQIAIAQQAVDLQRQKATLVGQEEVSRRSQIDQEDNWRAEGKKYLSDQVKMEQEIAAARTLGLSAGKSQAEIDQRISDIRKSYEKKLAGPANQLDLTGFNDAQNNLKSITGYYQNLEKELDSAQKAGLISAESYSSQRVAIVEQEKGDVTAAYEAEIAALEAVRDKSSTTGQQRIQIDQKIADARTSMVKAQKDADSQLEVLANNEKGRIDKQTRSIAQYIQALDQQQKALELAGQRAALGVGRGDRQNALDAQLNAQQDRFAQQTLDLANQKSDPSRNMSEEEFAKKSQALADANKKATDQIRQNYSDVQTAQGDWTNGATAAWENYLDSARDIAGQTKTLFSNAFSSMEDAVVNFALTGKLSFSDFAKSILADMARIATRQASSSLLSSLFGAGLSYFSGSSATSAGSTQAGYTGSDYANWAAAQADGGAWLNGVQMFANGGAFTNSIVSSPTAFGMAGGQTGVMGEAGPEAIVPLARTSSGALGIRSVGGSGGSSVQISAPVSISVEDRSSEGMQLDQTALAANLQAQIKQAAEKAVADSWRPGGVSFRQTRT